MYMKNKIIGILGGTFDPIHLGHTWIAQQILGTTVIKEIFFLPCYTPVHKSTPVATPKHRETMVQLAIEAMPQCKLSRVELAEKKPVYMCNTMANFAQEGITPVLIVGADVWSAFHTWKNPEDILVHGHILVINRPGYPWPPHMPEPFYASEALCNDQAKLQQQPNGHIYMHQLDFPDEFYDNFSSSTLRTQLSHDENPSHRLNLKVLAYCQQQHLYKSTHNND